MRYNGMAEGLLTAGEHWNKESPAKLLKYAVGALLYTPASHPTIAADICAGRYPDIKSITLCLEDAIKDGSVEQAEKQLQKTLHTVYGALDDGTLTIDSLPLIFIRVRDAAQMLRVAGAVWDYLPSVTGFVLPKFSQQSYLQYADALAEINGKLTDKPLYVMPIIESGQAIDLHTRAQTLCSIRDAVEQWGDRVLNIRVGGNDFCNQFGLRRPYWQTIYDIGVVSSALMDIFNIFGRDYVVSGPVWEYFGNSMEWKDGFRRELALDKVNGFVGKTAIHPSQLSMIQQNLIVNYADYMDAKAILEWDSPYGVSGSAYSHRMNEMKVHQKWAHKTLALAKVYGVKTNFPAEARN